MMTALRYSIVGVVLAALCLPAAVLADSAVGVNGLSFSKDGRYLAAADGRVLIWDLKSRRLADTWGRSPGGFLRVAYSPDGKTLAGLNYNGVITVWDLKSQYVSWELQGPYLEIQYSPNGKYLAGYGQTTIELIDVAAVQSKVAAAGGTLHADVSTLSPNLAWLAYSDEGGTYIVDRLHRKLLLKSTESDLSNLKFSPDARFLAGFDIAGSLRVLRTDSGKPAAALSVYEPICLAFSRDGSRIAVGTSTGYLYILDVAAGQARRIACRTGGVNAVAFSPGDKTIATGGDNGVVKLWNAHTLSLVSTLPGGSR